MTPRQPRDRERLEQKHVQTGGWWGSLIRSTQGNFDELNAFIRKVVRGHNSLVDDVEEMKDFINDNLSPESITEVVKQSGSALAETDPIASAAVTAHLGDASDAHDASAISVDSTTLVGTGTDQQAVDEEFDNAIVAAQATADNHIADTGDAHDASAISAADAGGYYAGTDVEAELQEIGAVLGTSGGSVDSAESGAGISPRKGLICWLVADDLDERYADAASVTKWYSRVGTWSGGSLVFAQATNPPIFKSAIVNGHDVVRFDGTNDILTPTSADYAEFSTNRGSMTGGHTVIAVVASDQNNASDCFFGKAQNPYEYEFRVSNGTVGPVGVWYQTGGSSHASVSYGSNINTGQFYVMTFRLDDLVEAKIWRDGGTGVASTSFTNTMVDTTSQLFLGERGDATHNYFDGDIAELLYFTRPLLHSELDKITNYLGAKYGITVTAHS